MNMDKKKLERELNGLRKMNKDLVQADCNVGVNHNTSYSKGHSMI